MTSPSPQNLADLLRDAQAGNQDAATQLYDRLRLRLLAVIAHALPPSLRKLFDAEDFLIDTFMEVFARRFSEEVVGSPQALWSYVKRIAENKVRDAKRKYLLTKRFGIQHEQSLDSLSTRGGARFPGK